MGMIDPRLDLTCPRIGHWRPPNMQAIRKIETSDRRE